MSPEEIKQHRVSLIVSTYNRPDALRVCLDSVKHQTILPYEVIIGDDGSRSETADTIKEISRNFPVPIKHVWHEDNGFQLAMMRNKSVAASSGDYIIEVDGDVFLHPKFIEDHLREAAPGIYVKGGRTNLGKELTEEICRQGMSRRISWLTKGKQARECPASEDSRPLSCAKISQAPLVGTRMQHVVFQGRLHQDQRLR